MSNDSYFQGIEKDGIQLLNGVLHSHLAARKMRIRQFRNGKELPIVMEDNHYDFNFQSSRQPRRENGGRVLPGDELFVECDYETKDRDKPTFGGRLLNLFYSSQLFPLITLIVKCIN